MYTGSHESLSTLILIGHLLQNLLIGEARVCGAIRLERVSYNPTYRKFAGADCVVCIRYRDDAPAEMLWQVRTRDLAKPGPLTKAARALAALHFDPIQARRETAAYNPLERVVPGLMTMAVEEA